MKSTAKGVYETVCSGFNPSVGVTTAAVAAGLGIYAFCVSSSPHPDTSMVSWLSSRKVLSGTLTCLAVPALVVQLLRHEWVGIASYMKSTRVIVGVLCVLVTSLVVQQLKLRAMGGITAVAVYRKLMNQFTSTT